MQNEIFQAFICYYFDDYVLQLMQSITIIIKIITSKGLKYHVLHVMSLYNILVSPFKWAFAPYSNFSSFTCTKSKAWPVLSSQCISRLYLVHWHLQDLWTASVMWCSFTQTQFHPSADVMFSWPRSRMFTVVHGDSAETWPVAKVCFCSCPLEVSHDLGFTINRLYIITYLETNATWAWLFKSWKKMMGISNQAFHK